jgi:DNA-binding NarL/FixJ family response regulator
MIRVLVVDDHPVVRTGLSHALSSARDITIVGEVASSDEAIKKLASVGCDVMLLDINMPGKSGVDALHELRQTHPAVRVLMLSMYPEEQFAGPLMKAGAAGYITKDADPQQLMSAIRTVAAGRRFVSERYAEVLADRYLGGHERPLHEKLSAREHQTFLLIAQGESVSVIAGKLSLSVKTISTFRASILRKMGMDKNTDLTRYAIQHGLIEMPIAPNVRR